MKFSSSAAHLLLGFALSLGTFPFSVLSAQTCKYCAIEPGSLPKPMEKTLIEMASQQESSKGLDPKLHMAASYFLQPSSGQDIDDIMGGIQKTLLAFHVDHVLLEEHQDDEYHDFGLLSGASARRLIIPGVNLESLSYGPFELSYHLKEGFGLTSADPTSPDGEGFYSFYDLGLTQDDVQGMMMLEAFPDSNEDICEDEDNLDWHLKHTRVYQAWEYSAANGKASRGEGIVIAQIDSGYTEKHAFFQDLFEDGVGKGYDLIDDDLDPKDKLTATFPAHGTVVASVAMNRGNTAMEGTNNKFKAPSGTAPSARLYSIRAIFDPILYPNDSDRLRSAFDKINDGTIKAENVHVISMSLGTPTPIGGGLEGKIEKAIENNSIVVAAGGQSVAAFPPVINPAAFDEVIAVGGYRIANRRGNLAEGFHNRKMEWWRRAHSGKKIHISAPAFGVCNANIKKKSGEFVPFYKTGEGTSLATAMTGGIAALWLAHHGRDELIRRFSPHNINLNTAFRKALELTARRSGWWQKSYNTNRFGYGMIDAEAIVKLDVDEIIRAVENDKNLATKEEATEGIEGDLLEIGYSEQDLSLFSSKDLEHFGSELLYLKEKSQALKKDINLSFSSIAGADSALFAISSALDAHLKAKEEREMLDIHMRGGGEL